LKRTPFLSVGYSEILNRNEDAFEKSLSSHKVFNGVNIFLEEKNTTYSQDNISKWNTVNLFNFSNILKIFYKFFHKFLIKFKIFRNLNSKKTVVSLNITTQESTLSPISQFFLKFSPLIIVKEL